MAVQAQFGGGLPGCLPFGGGLADEQMYALWDYSALLSATAAAGKGGYPCAAAGVVSAAQSELTCNNGGGGGVALPSRKRGRDAELDQYVVSPSSSAALLPIPSFVAQQPSLAACRMVGSGTASTSGRAAAVDASAVADALVVAELFALQGGAEVDALVRAECEWLRAAMEPAFTQLR